MKKDKRKFTQEELGRALYDCVKSDNMLGAEIALQAGAKADGQITWHAKKTPLHAAAQDGRTAFCKLLVAHGANVNVKTDTGYTALAFAVMTGEKARNTGLWLIAHGANSKKEENGHLGDFKFKGIELEGMSMHEAALRCGDWDRLKELLQTSPPKNDNDDLQNLIKLAKSMKKDDICAILQSIAASNAIEESLEAELKSRTLSVQSQSPC